MDHSSVSCETMFLAETSYAIDKSSTWKCKFWDFWLLAWKITKFLMSFFKPRVSFQAFSAMTHNSCESFKLKYYMLWTIRALQCTIFQAFKWSNESSPNSSFHFWNHKVRIDSIFALLFSFMKDNSSLLF